MGECAEGAAQHTRNIGARVVARDDSKIDCRCGLVQDKLVVCLIVHINGIVGHCWAARLQAQTCNRLTPLVNNASKR